MCSLESCYTKMEISSDIKMVNKKKEADYTPNRSITYLNNKVELLIDGSNSKQLAETNSMSDVRIVDCMNRMET